MSRWKATWGRSWPVPALVGAIMVSVAACSPELRPLAAVYVDGDGTPHALLRACDEDGRIRGPWLQGRLPTEAPDDATADEAEQDANAPEASAGEASAMAQPWIGWDTAGLHEAADFPLFSPPTAWKAVSRGPQTLRPGYEYELGFADPSDSYVYNGLVTFDAGQLAAVPPGQVLTARGAMTREAFEDAARSAC
ncbi:hypothetical protein [Streptomyces sp. NPDC056632]|uniref:hypothetical protein n=1 Tax=Streptomyces sp. NPDC056632 TaxID=3345884 RepID=UPI0036C4041B